MTPTSTETTKTAPPRARRRKYIINSAFQWKYTLAICIGVFLVASLMGIALFGILHQQARARILFPGSTDIWSNTGIIGLFAVAFSIVVLITLCGWGIFVTHRISGPLYVLRRNLEDLVQGRLPARKALRKKDEFKDLFESFWRAVAALRERRQAELTTLSAVLQTAASALDGDGDKRKNALQSIATQLEALRAEITEALGEQTDPSFRTPSSACGRRKPEALAAAGTIA